MRSHKNGKWRYRCAMWTMNLDFGTSEIRMKEITKYKRFCEWKSEIYLFNCIDMDNKISLRQQVTQMYLNQRQGIDIDTLSAKIYTSLPSIVRAILDGTVQIIR